MLPDYQFIFPLPAGLHARPAGALADIAGAFAADIRLLNERTGTSVCAKSMLSMISADIRKGDSCRLHVAGTDEAAAYKALREFIDLVLPFSDEPLAQSGARQGSAALPCCLEKANPPFVSGTVIHPGIGQGRLVFLRGLSLPDTVKQHSAGSPEQEEGTLVKAMDELRIGFERQLIGCTATAAAILRAHLSIVNDSAFLDKLLTGVRQGRTAGQAVVDAGRFFMDTLAAGSDYIRERAADIQEICLQLLHELYGGDYAPPAVCLTEPSIVVADHLDIRQLMDMDRTYLKGLVAGQMGFTSHAAILARAFDIPTLSGIPGTGLPAGRQVVVDAQQGLLITAVDDSVSRYYEKETDALNRRNARLALQARTAAVTADGVRLEIGANISTAEEVERAVALGAEGVGLFRTEMLYLSGDSAPAEDIQVEIYRKALLQADGRAVTIRSFDIGGDKPASYLNLPQEGNPFLGYRGVRIYREYLEFFETQLCAVLRASACGKLRLMIPMVSSVEEIRWVKERIAAIRAVFKTGGVPFDPDMEIGVMIETPAAAFAVETLSGEVDFFSIGTNDLSQYFFAADRTNEKVSGLCRVRHPAFLRILSHVVTQAHAGGKWVGLCGEMAADPVNLPLLAGLGLDEISTGAAEIPRLKQILATWSSAACCEVLGKSMGCSTAAEVDELLATVTASSNEPLLETGMVILDSDSANKEEAIRELVNALYATGRTDDPSAVEAAVWGREAVGVTGFGFGFGVPHCKSDAMKTNSIGIARFGNPFSWNPKEDEPVRMIIMLAMRQSGSGNLHMQIFSKLARKLMHEDFRSHLLEAATARDVMVFLESELGLTVVNAAK